MRADREAVAPFQELPADAPFEQARAAVSAIRGQGRRQDGTAGPGNTLALRHGLNSARLMDTPAIAAWHAERVAAIEADLGGADQLSALARATVREVARLEVVAAALGDELLAHGVLTGKGKTRAATATYLHVLDRFVRLSAALGLERQSKSVTIREYLREHARVSEAK